MVHICPACSKSYTQSGSLNRNMSVAHGSKLYECDVCHRNLSTKSTLDRHKRIKHGSDNKIQEEGKYSDSEMLRETENNDKNVFTNKVGWVETDNKEEIDNSDGEESNMDLDNKEDIANDSENTGPDNKESEESTVDTEETNNNASVNNLDYTHDLFDIVETSKEMCDRLKYCLHVATFRIHPPPVHIKRINMYSKWLDNVFEGILEYFAPKYSPDPEDFVSLDIFHTDTNKSIWLWPRKRKELNAGVIVSKILKEMITNPSGDLTVALNCLKSKVSCPTCGHTKVTKDGIVYSN